MEKIEANKELGMVSKYLGQRSVIDKESGLEFELDLIQKEVRHGLKYGWNRVYLDVFLGVLTDLYGNAKKLQVIEYILLNLDSENKFCYTQKQVIEATNSSSATIVELYKYLTKSNFWKKTGNVYTINPEMVCAFGSDKKNRMIAIRFLETETGQKSKKEDKPIPDHAEEIKTLKKAVNE